MLCNKVLEEQAERIKIEGHRRRNNLNFFKINEKKNESMEQAERKLRFLG